VRAIVLLCCLAVAGCVEVTRFPGPDGDVYLAECDNQVRLQSCRAALESVCPNGYDWLENVTRNQGGKWVATKSGYFRCR
jgi:hypothetical protein